MLRNHQKLCTVMRCVSKTKVATTKKVCVSPSSFFYLRLFFKLKSVFELFALEVK